MLSKIELLLSINIWFATFYQHLYTDQQFSLIPFWNLMWGRLNILSGWYFSKINEGYRKHNFCYYCIRGNFFFNCYLAAPQPTFGPLSRGQPHSPNFNHCIFYIFDPRVTGSLVARLGLCLLFLVEIYLKWAFKINIWKYGYRQKTVRLKKKHQKFLYVLALWLTNWLTHFLGALYPHYIVMSALSIIPGKIARINLKKLKKSKTKQNKKQKQPSQCSLKQHLKPMWLMWIQSRLSTLKPHWQSR